MNMFLHELRAYRKSTIIWVSSICGLAIMYLSIYPTFSRELKNNQAMLEGIKRMVENSPEVARKALGFSLESFTTILGFYTLVFGYITLCGAIQAMNIGTSIVSKEVHQKTADFLLTKPVSRREILTAKLLAALAILLITNVIYIIVAVTIASLLNPGAFSINIFLMISFTLFFVQLMFMSLGVVMSVSMRRIKSVIAVSLGTVFSFFIINMFGSVIGDKAVRYITPFKFYDMPYIIRNASYEIQFLIIEAVFIIAAIFVSYRIYIKKDIHAV